MIPPSADSEPKISFGGSRLSGRSRTALLLPPVARTFWDAIYGLADAVGLDGFAAMDGLRMFTFWR